MKELEQTWEAKQSTSATRTDANVNCTLYIASIQKAYELHKLQIDPKM